MAPRLEGQEGPREEGQQALVVDGQGGPKSGHPYRPQVACRMYNKRPTCLEPAAADPADPAAGKAAVATTARCLVPTALAKACLTKVNLCQRVVVLTCLAVEPATLAYMACHKAQRYQWALVGEVRAQVLVA